MEELQALYQSILGRPADDAGLQYWSGILGSGQANLSDIAQNFRQSPEYQSMQGGLLGGATTQAPVTQMPQKPVTVAPAGMSSDAANAWLNSNYQTLFGRAPDEAGRQYWLGLLTSGQLTTDQVLANLRQSNEAGTYYESQGPERAGIREVPFGSQGLAGQVKPTVDYSNVRSPSPTYSPGSLADTFLQSLNYQSRLPSQTYQFNPADMPSTFQQIAAPRQRLDISNIQLPAWLQAAAARDAANAQALTDAQIAQKATQTGTGGGVTNVGVGYNPVTGGGTSGGGLLGGGSSTPTYNDSWIYDSYSKYLDGRAPDAAGLAYWQSQAAQPGADISGLISAIANSQEAQGLLASNSQPDSYDE